MTNPVGFLWKRPDALYGQRGIAYDYVVAGNGVYVEAQGEHLAARVPVSECQIRGLADTEPRFVLKHGKIPYRFWALATSVFLADPAKEKFVVIRWTLAKGYHLRIPEQEGDASSCKFVIGEDVTNVVLEAHSHCGRAFFSGTDDRDEQSFRLYAVVGKLDEHPQFRLRCGVYGHFWPVVWQDVFDWEFTDPWPRTVWERDLTDREQSGQTCHVCGCTDSDACTSGGSPCHWTAPDLCSACAAIEAK